MQPNPVSYVLVSFNFSGLAPVPASAYSEVGQLIGLLVSGGAQMLLTLYLCIFFGAHAHTFPLLSWEFFVTSFPICICCLMLLE